MAVAISSIGSPPAGLDVARHVLSAAAGIGFTLLILVALARAPESVVERPQPVLQVVHSVESLEPPPPPPQQFGRGAPALSEPSPIEMAPSSSPVKLTVPLVPIAQTIPNAPKVLPEFEVGLSFRPRMEASETGQFRVFRRFEVDQVATVLYRKAPRIPREMVEKLSDPRVMLLFIVNLEGRVEGVRLLHSAEPRFDGLIIEAVKQWRFRPAMKDGARVRQWVQLPVRVVLRDGDPFHLN